MPTFGQHEFLPLAIKGVLSQTATRVRLIVVSVKSDTPTRKVLDRLRVRYVESDRADHIHQINIGVEDKRSDWVAVSASDDYMLPGKLASELAVAENRNALVVYSDFFYGDEQLNVVGACRTPEFSYERLVARCMINDCSLVSRETYNEFGLLNEGLGSMAFFDRWLRIGEKYPERIVHNPYPGFIYRRHQGQKSSDIQNPKRLTMMLHVARESLKRRGLDPATIKGYRVVPLAYTQP